MMNFERVKHDADKTGNYAHYWKGSITLISTQENIDEIESARDFESMVIAGALKMHGKAWRLTHINFNFKPTREQKEEYGNGVTCVVVVGYLSDVSTLGLDEMAGRLGAMGLELPTGE